MTTTEKPATPYQVIGTRPVRPDGVDKVTGRAEYGADVKLSGMLYGRVKRSPYAHAVIKRIDASRALALPGVLGVVTGADFPELSNNPVPTIRGPIPERWTREPLIAAGKALYKGHPIAAVAATDPHIAEDALDLIDVEYEVLPPVMSVEQAIAPDTTLLHDPAVTAEIKGLFEPVNGRQSNIARQLEIRMGDVEQGFAESDIVIEREFSTASAHQGYIEPHNATALWNRDGLLTIWTSTQGAFGVRDALAGILKLPVSRVRVVPMEIGGGFGGKIPVYLEPLAAMLSRRTGRPVQITMSRTEVFEASGPTSATQIRVKMGAKRDGTLVAGEVHLAYEAGAYPGAPVPGAARSALAPYNMPHHLVQGFEVVVNKPKVAAYRAPGAPQAEFAVESVVDELAEILKMDPIEFRLQNASRQGVRRSEGVPHGSVGTEQVLQAARDSAHYRSEIHGDKIGRGVATGYWGNGGNESAAYAIVNADGTVTLITGSVDIGGQRASLAMQFAETLGIPYETVKSTVGDTDTIGYTSNTGGSRTTFATGWAVIEAAYDIRGQLIARAAKIWDVEPEKVTYDAGVLREEGGQTMTFKEIARKLAGSGGAIQGRAAVKPSGVGAAVATHICDVHVDTDTGKVTVLRYTAVQDVGKAIHPSYVEGQLQGGAAQGIGMALNEGYVYRADGSMANSSYLDYRMPVANDLPPIETVLVEVPNPGHPYGVRGVGEVPIVPPLAAVANAIYDAIGVRVRHLPASPAVILDELERLKA
ncbi:MAG: xanthine dehydrogenase family protein molybdopterin-binding subunit [Dehalococcoidia bacterium]|nr:MAG: xanthine dehydrogenase family protein molybdopterin-binding subunit [Dehalococcoidia bacterium]